MFKPNNKKMLTVLITLAMILSALAVISMAAQPAYAAASGTVTYNPTTIGIESGIAVQTVAFVSGGSFTSGATVYFYLSSTDSATGLLFGGDAIGGTILTASSPTTLSQAVTFFPSGDTVTAVNPSSPSGYNLGPTASITPGTYYILASMVVPPTTPAGLSTGGYAFPAASSQFVPQTASFSVLNAVTMSPATGANALTVGSTGIAYGTGFDSGASVSVFLNYPGGTVLTTATANSFGLFEVPFTVPQLAGTVEVNQYSGVYTSITSSYNVVAQETNTYSASTFPQGGITADAPMDIAPSLAVSPLDIQGTAGTSLTLTGTGFPAGGVIAASTSTAPSTSIEINGLSGTPVESNTYHSSVTVSASGQFTLTVTLVSSITPTKTTGPLSISTTLTDSAPYTPRISNLFSPALYISSPNPQDLGFYFAPVPIAGTYYPVFSPLVAAVFDFPASTLVSVYIGSTLVGNVTTDSNGFGILPSTAIIPAMPAGTYTATAMTTSGLVAVPTVGVTGTISISSFYMATDPIGNTLFTAGPLASNEYVPQNGTITVSAYGLAPATPYLVTDSAIGNIVLYGTNVTVSVGSVYFTGTELVPAANGTLIFSYQPFYGYYGMTTGTPVTISVGSTPAFLSSLGSVVGYLEIGAPSFVLSSQIVSPGGSMTVSVTNLIPAPRIPSPVTFYPGTSGYYNIYIGSSEITSTTPASESVFSGKTLSSGVTFTVPSLSSGLYNVSVTYAGQPVSMAFSPENSLNSLVVVSTPGRSLSSGNVVTLATESGGIFSGYVIAGYGLLPSEGGSLTIYNSLGPNTGAFRATDAAGAFFDSADLSATGTIYSGSSAGTFSIVLSLGSGSSVSEFFATYMVTPTLKFSSGLGYVGPVYYVLIGETITMAPTGLVSGTYYDVYFGSHYLETVHAATPTSFVRGESTFIVPTVPSGLYFLNLTYTGTTTVVVSEPVYVLPSYYGTITMTSAQGIPTEYAFPGEIVSFFWTPSTTTGLVKPGATNDAGPVYVTVYLNGTAYVTIPATYGTVGTTTYLNGSFLAPNAAAGSYWAVSFGWTQTEYKTTATTSATTSNYIGTSMAYLGLVSGAGALVVSISSSEIASIITSSINSALQVPLSELSANITALHGDIVNITTSFGKMTTTLQAINATVQSISSGQAIILTDLGMVQTSLASLNASIVSISGNVVTINTTLGNVVTTLAGINAQATTNGNGIAKIQTDLGTISGQIVSTNGNISTIKTNLGYLNTTVSKINTNTSGFSTLEIFLIVAIVLILITLVIAFMAVNNTNKLAKKLEEQKKQ